MGTGRMGGEWGRALGWAGAGSLVLTLWMGIGSVWIAPRGRLEAQALWLSDRDGDRVWSLNAEGLLVTSISISHPLEVAPGAAGGLWVLSAGLPHGKHQRLSFLSAEGELGAQIDLPGARCLGADALGAAQLLTGDGEQSVWVSYDRSGRCLRELPAGDAIRWETLPSGIVVVGPRWLCLYPALSDYGSFPFPQRNPLRAGARVLSSCTQAGTLWLLIARGDERWLQARGEGLQVLWEGPLAAGAPSNALDWFLTPAIYPALWIVPRSGAGFLWHPRRTYLRHFQSVAPVRAVRRAQDGGLWIATPGSLERVDSSGSHVPGQGGFDFLTGMATAWQVD
jgi:hypothetical protein